LHICELTQKLLFFVPLPLLYICTPPLLPLLPPPLLLLLLLLLLCLCVIVHMFALQAAVAAGGSSVLLHTDSSVALKTVSRGVLVGGGAGGKTGDGVGVVGACQC
jgi:hypothetical protein